VGSLTDKLDNLVNYAIVHGANLRSHTGFFRMYMELREDIARIELDNRWIPVTERLPEIGEEVIAWAHAISMNSDTVYGWTYATATYQGPDDPWGPWSHDFYSQNIEVSHWREKLDPPGDVK
jgi:hypothetical protein